ncbi:NADH-quinone oxidoreductase subunit N [Actinoplanes sp. SE50]|uniref:NADH-quinone oxidoreductase subunit N n=1 Tax=unclassified Actinoplanes TaxID=2626549 RepID=UPI00023ED188|nr:MULTISPECIES: NADH-quinone oxidoreductase subunit N [unclassified Actinoplanes]AEV81644.1 NADH dehydrogenase I subunit N [Actinoplanes sp. SE50/110]ATO80045.1 NADH-quinone oxidoreductase subunit N [Actinoplanes sp. SE50]SLL97449.1 NADH-quinone oxidoreductase subunit N [Actinoplanes sp. SE50/110]
MSQSVDHFALLPLYAAAGTAILAFLADLFLANRTAVLSATALGGLATAVLALVVGPEPGTFCTTGACSWLPTWPAAVTAALFAALTVGVLALSTPALRLGIAPAGEFCFLLACSMTGGVVIAYAGDLITLIVGLETLTLPLYVLVGLRRFAPGERPTTAGVSASLTFFLISVVSTAVTLLGAALNYAATGSVHLALLHPATGPFRPLAGVGVALLVIGLAFKVAAVPLHAWAPATYDGAPLPVAAYLSTASKLGGVLALAAIVARLDARAVMAVLAVLTMTIGNLVALRQTRMVRLLAWSSIAQAGYILAALALGAPGVPAALAYAVLFMVLEFIAFTVVTALRLPGADGGTILDHRGAARRNPWPGAALTLSLAGLAGLPPGLAGLFAKLSVVDVLIRHHWSWLAAVVVLNAVIALAYYIRVTATLYSLPPRIGMTVADPALMDAALHPRLPVSRPVAATLAVSVAVAIVLGFAPQLLFAALS